VKEISNLGNIWPISGSIGDIEPLFPGGHPYGNDQVDFTTGGSAYSLNSISLEFEFDSSYPAGRSAPQALSVQLFQGSSLLGNLANPTASPISTQWPAYTKFYDFGPTTKIILNPNTRYSLVISMPGDSSVDAALMFSSSSNYISHDGWIMGPTSTPDNLYAQNYYLKFAVDATAVPDGANTAVLLSAGLGVIIWCRRELGRKTVAH
jgi:hypothetical protein